MKFEELSKEKTSVVEQEILKKWKEENILEELKKEIDSF